MDLLIKFCAEYLYLSIPLTCILQSSIATPLQRKSALKFTLLIFPISYLLDFITNSVIASPRPFMTSVVTPLVPFSLDNGFPSGHTLFCFVVASIVFVQNRKIGVLLYLVGALVGISRVLAHVHNPIDIIGSIVIVLIAGVFSRLYQRLVL